jgi:hypothetical protein
LVAFVIALEAETDHLAYRLYGPADDEIKNVKGGEKCMTAKMKSAVVLTPSQLVDALDALGVPFLRGGCGATGKVEPGDLLAALAASAEARLRLSLIPLLLAHPEYSAYATTALRQMQPATAITLRCYYTAALWLQVKYRARITASVGTSQWLPDLFGAELHLMEYTDPDAALRALAARQQALSGRVLNWLGSYEHAAQTWLQQLEQGAKWKQSQPINSMRS